MNMHITPTQSAILARRRAFHAIIEATCWARRPVPPPPPPRPRVVIEPVDRIVIINMMAAASSELIIQLCAAKHGCTVADIHAKTRAKPAVTARHEAAYLIKTHRPDMSYPMVARIFGMDHTTIIHACRRVVERLASEATSG